MDHDSILKTFEVYIPAKQWPTVLKVAIKYKENKWLLWTVFFKMNSYRMYFLKVTYVDETVKFIPLPYDAKEEIKPHVMTFNFYLSSIK